MSRFELCVKLLIGLSGDRLLHDAFGYWASLQKFIVCNMANHVPKNGQRIPIGFEPFQGIVGLNRGWAPVHQDTLR